MSWKQVTKVLAAILLLSVVGPASAQTDYWNPSSVTFDAAGEGDTSNAHEEAFSWPTAGTNHAQVESSLYIDGDVVPFATSWIKRTAKKTFTKIGSPLALGVRVDVAIDTEEGPFYAQIQASGFGEVVATA